MDFYQRALAELQTRYPETARRIDLRERVSPLILCPHLIPLPRSLAEQAERVVRAFFALRGVAPRDRALSAAEPKVVDPGNFSVLMSYDFHVDSNGNLRLIEINTNASASLVADLLYAVHGARNPFSADFRKEIIAKFMDEARLALGARAAKRAAIVDENPSTQKAYFEFEMYRELLSRAGLEVEIADANELSFENDELRLRGKVLDLVYNRHTDFYFESPATAALRSAMLARAACLSPHPHEYRLLADKQRLMELSKPGAIEALPIAPEHRLAISGALIRTLEVKEFESPEALWSERKNWFFKTKQSFGGKAAYRGSGVARSVFAQVVAGPYLAQEYVPAPTVKPKGADQEFKYDLRFYVYRDRIQLACARLYQGQLTNSQTPGGGIAAVDWV